MDHYEILGVSPNASEAVIRVAYRQRLKEVHPDTGHPDAHEFEAVLAAGAVLLEPSGREGYDQRAQEPDGLRGKARLVAGLAAGLLALAILFLASPWSSGDEVADQVQGAMLLAPSLGSGDDEEPVAPTATEVTTEPTSVPTTEPTAEPTVEQEAASTEEATQEAATVATGEDDAGADQESSAASDSTRGTGEDVPADGIDRSELPDLADLPERGAIYRAPTLFLVGPVPSQEIADAFFAKAADVVGAENVVNEYVIHPDAPTDVNGNVRVEQAITFETASAVIRPEFVPVVGLAFEVLNQNPQARLIIEGHTDSVGAADTNQRLSEARASAVVAWLVERGIDPERLSGIGFGEAQPVADNETEEGRSINRRIEVQILDLLS